MTTRRKAIVGLLGTAAVSAVASAAAAGDSRLLGLLQASSGAAKTVMPAKLERPVQVKSPPPFVPSGIADRAEDFGYVAEEWFASGTDDTGRPYQTQVYLYRPQDMSRFSGTVIVEPLHAQSAPPVFMYTSREIMREGHGWACIASQKMTVDGHIKPKDPEHYASLQVAGADGSTAPADLGPADSTDPAAMAARQARLAGNNQASNAILAQVGLALRRPGSPFGDGVEHIILAGHSQTGGVVTTYITGAHESHRRGGGAPIYDGYFPSGAPRLPFGPRDVPLIQVVSDGDVSDSQSRGPEFAGRRYRRPDSDEPGDRFRLYELAGTGHMGTRYPPHNNPKAWANVLGPDSDGAIMNSMPHYEQFRMGLHHLVDWVTKGVAPPRAPRLELAEGGRYIAKDQHGNSLGGVRSPQIDVPRATYFPNPTNPDGTPRRGVVGTEKPFDATKMRQLYGTPENYTQQFNRRLDELIEEGWLLPADREALAAEAAAQEF
jgi:hypothetical protein